MNKNLTLVKSKLLTRQSFLVFAIFWSGTSSNAWSELKTKDMQNKTTELESDSKNLKDEISKSHEKTMKLLSESRGSGRGDQSLTTEQQKELMEGLKKLKETHDASNKQLESLMNEDE